MSGYALSNIQRSSCAHIFGYPRCAEAVAAHSFLESAGAGSGLHELPNARAVHMPQFRCFLVFSKRWEKGSRRITSKIGIGAPLEGIGPSLRGPGHLMRPL